MADPGERAGFSDPHIRRRRRDGSSAAPLQLFLPSPAGPRPALASRAALLSRGRASRAAPASSRLPTRRAGRSRAGAGPRRAVGPGDAARAVAGTVGETGTRGRCRRYRATGWPRSCNSVAKVLRQAGPAAAVCRVCCDQSAEAQAAETAASGTRLGDATRRCDSEARLGDGAATER